MARSFQRTILWAALIVLGLLTALSICGAFLGAQHARDLFNSPPLVVFWFLLAGLLAAGLLFFKRPLHSPGLLLTHLGSLLVLAGAMYGSPKGHALAQALWGGGKIHSGYMLIFKGEQTNLVADKEGNIIGELPFQLRLEDFWIEYYPPKDDRWQLLVEAGWSDRTGDGMLRMVRDSHSRVAVPDECGEKVHGTIKVNAPLRYGGYHFYRSGYDQPEKRCTVLKVVSDSGLNLAYAGLSLLVLGTFWVFWLRPAGAALRRRLKHHHDD